ncbi:P-loop containing nucleoside triphosphate hydrolase [Arabidopsis suecica]|uniref:ADP-ribosyl cyclase/cyclic ADP-ribose hydrolase n=1 Tax=Arabidopsis suecica TaxID=45249 RepID=A0A8T2DDF8_ARASU|nr:P-loop containing nucleoside triphosphate hydrolase [Arabidopsis suecica]
MQPNRASSSLSSTPTRTWTHHVFLSFSGEHVRKGFLSHIQKEFKRKGIFPFVDTKMKRGSSIGPVLSDAIIVSKIAIVLLSKNYASSTWCLNELVNIMKCREEFGQTVMTVFYEVDPSDVRKQTGDFGIAFETTCVGKTEEVKQSWRQALIDVSNIVGEVYRIWSKESDLIDKIAEDVLDELNYTMSRDFDGYVGIGRHMRKMKSLLCLESGDVRMIGIVGPPGIGKTTIARALRDQISENFQLTAFIDDIRLTYPRRCYGESGLKPPTAFMNDDRRKIVLQTNFLSEILNQKDIVIHNLNAAPNWLKDRKVLVILDDVDHLEQLDAMAKETGWFGYGSRIIITTQDRKLLKAHNIDYIYEVGLPRKDDALQIFCLSAFGQNFPHDDFQYLACEVTQLAGELPLGLKVLGSYLKGMSLEEWKNALPRLKTCLDGDIEKTLRYSYDALSRKDQALFLHIACLFRGYESKSLISIDMGFLNMHSLLQQLGVEIVRNQSSQEPRERQFLVDVNDISDVFTYNTAGTKSILGIRLNVPEIEEKIVIDELVFDGMTNLQFLFVNEGFGDKLSLPRGLNCLPGKLRVLHWNYCPLRFWPSKFSANFLVELVMRGNNFEKLWEKILPLKSLKRMDLSHSKDLKEIPDLSNATNLEELDLSSCSGLLELTDSIGKATNLKRLKLACCSLLKKLPSSIGDATNLQVLDLFHCESFEELPKSIGKLTNLKVLELMRCYKLVTLPNSIKTPKLPVLSMSECEDLQAFPTYINLEDCTQLKMFPEISTNVKELDLRNTAIENVPSSICSWSCLYRLDMSECRNLKEFPNVPVSIVELDLSKTEIEEVPSWIENLLLLRTLTMVGCKRLNIISPNISKLKNLEDLELFTDGVSGDAASFYALVEFSDRHDWTLESDFQVHYILPICLPKMAISLSFWSYDFETIPDCIKCLPGLSELDVSGCRNLVSLPQLPGSLLSLDANNCESLERINGSFQDPKICLNFTNCINLNQEARKLIQTSACKYALLPGAEVPANFTHQATSGSLTINITTKTLPSRLRYKACILLSKGNINLEDEDENSFMPVSCHVMGKQNVLIPRSPVLRGYTDHLYIFDYSFSLHEYLPEAKEATFRELMFDFIVHSKTWNVKSCGVHLFEVPHHFLIPCDVFFQEEQLHAIRHNQSGVYPGFKNVVRFEQ